MFVVHTLIDGKNTTRDFGHVNMFFRENPLFRQAKDEEIFKRCVEQGFIYIQEYEVVREGRKEAIITYQNSLVKLQEEVTYNRQQFIGKRH